MTGAAAATVASDNVEAEALGSPYWLGGLQVEALEALQTAAQGILPPVRL